MLLFLGACNGSTSYDHRTAGSARKMAKIGAAYCRVLLGQTRPTYLPILQIPTMKEPEPNSLCLRHAPHCPKR